MPLMVICDFDGTIMDADTGKLVLERFADGDWRHFDRLYDEMKMPVAEVLRRQFAMVRSTKKAMLSAIEGSARVREGFGELLQVCRIRGVPLVVASYGLDFCIRHYLRQVPLGRRVRVVSPSARVTPRGITLRFPRPLASGTTNIKEGLVKHYRARGERVVYVGDGTSDLLAVRAAEVRFAMKGSRLARLCKKHSIIVEEVSNFGPVAEVVCRETER